jgi:NADPH2:quinone reductase
MRAIVATKTGPAAEVLSIRELPTPAPQAGEVRVRIATSGINPSDVKRRGAAPLGSPLEFPLIIPHSDGAGTIDAVGTGIAPVRIGQRVWLYNAQWQRPYGTAAEYCVVPGAYAVPLPDQVEFSAAASFGIPALTAYHAIHIDGPVRGMTLLVQGGAGAVAFYATVIATVSSLEKAAYARRAGADHTIDYKTEDRQLRVAELTGGKRVDRIIEVDLAANALTYPGLLAEYGTAVVYGSGAPIAQIPSTFIRWSTSLLFFIVYQLKPEERSTAIDAIDSMLRADALDHGEIRRFPFDQVVQAHEAVEGGSLGNVVLDVG